MPQNLRPYRRVLISLAILALALLSACSLVDREPRQVEFAELVGNPQDYNDERVCTQGVHLTAFEVDALGESTYEQGEAVYLSEPTIWTAGAEISPQGDCFTVDDYPGATFCPVEACGRFEAGGHYGHLGGYAFQLSETKVPAPGLRRSSP